MEVRMLATAFLKAFWKYFTPQDFWKCCGDDRKNWYRFDYEGSLFL
jgi:hypothetical protein